MMSDEQGERPDEDAGMPVFTIKAKDNLALDTVWAYRQLCIEHELFDQAAEVDKAFAEIQDWRAANPRRWKMPDHAHVPAAARLPEQPDEGKRP